MNNVNMRIVNLKRVTVSCQDYGSSTTECVGGDWFGEVGELDLADLKQEHDDVCCFLCSMYSVYYDVKNLCR